MTPPVWLWSRRALIAGTLALGSVFVVLASSHLAPRGLVRTVYATPDWSGDPVSQEHSGHVDFGPDLNRHRWTLPPQSSLTYTGYLYAPRQGDYAFGIDSADAVWLTVGGAAVVTHNAGRPPVTGAVFLRQGLHPIELRLLHRNGTSDLMVSWAPPATEYLVTLSPVFLTPTPVSDSAPLNLGLSAAVCFATALLVALGRPGRSARLGLLAAAGALLVLVPLALFAEESRDEAAVAIASRAAFGNAIHGILHSGYWGLGARNPPLGYWFYGALTYLTGSGALVVMRLGAACCTAATVGVVASFAARRLDAPRAAAGAVILSTCPALLGFGTTATLDAPALLTLTLAIIRVIDAFEAPRPNRALLGAGVWAGLAMATRLSGALVLAFGAAMHLARAVSEHRRDGTTRLPLGLLGAPVVAVLVAFILWPWLWRSPFGQLLAALGQWQYAVTERFLGSTGPLPLAYLPVQLFFTTPALWLVAMGLGLARRPSCTGSFPVGATLALWASVPFVAALSDVEADGARHLLPALPPLAILGGHVIWTLAIPRVWRVTGLVTAAGWVVSQVVAAAPFPTEYRSEILGGVAGADASDIAPVGLLAAGARRTAEQVEHLVTKDTTLRLDGVPPHMVSVVLQRPAGPPAHRATHRPDVILRNGTSPGARVLEGYLVLDVVVVDGVPVAQVALRDGSEARARYEAQLRTGGSAKLER